MSTKTKRMSAEEKRKAILGVYHSTKEVYTEKEIIALSAKAGVNQNTWVVYFICHWCMCVCDSIDCPCSTFHFIPIHHFSIADINQACVDDGLVDKEKIGGSNYFWSFPAKKDRLNQLQHEETLKKNETLKTGIKEADARLADAKRGREEDESGERATKMARRVELTKSLASAQVELDKLKQNDPQEIANLEKELQYVTNGAHRWTDNIFSCKDYLVKKRGMDKKEANKIIGITDNFDYPEDKMASKKWRGISSGGGVYRCYLGCVFWKGIIATTQIIC